MTSWRLPKVRDGKKGWRAGAVFSREELEALISDSRVPHDRRVMYALASVGCLRHGEAAGLRSRDVVFGLEPLGRIVVLTSYDQGDTKTGAERWMGRPRAAQFFETSAVRAMDERAQRKSLYAAFEYLHQMQFVQIASGLHNRCVYDDPRYTDTGPLPASVLITDAAIRQWSVLSSRAAFERFADLLHLLERGERIPSSTSRLKKLRAFLFLPASRFVYFAPVVQLARQFDEAHRTAAAHGGSSMPRHFLSLERPDNELLNRELDLANVLLNMWRPLIDILNGCLCNCDGPRTLSATSTDS